MINTVGLFTLLLSLNGGEFKDIQLLCSNNQYTFVKGNGDVGLRNNGNDYITKYKNIDELDEFLNTKCKGKK